MKAFDEWRHNHEAGQGGIVSSGDDWVTREQKAAWKASAKRFSALANELEEVGMLSPYNSHELYIAKRIREILEET